MGEFVLNLLHRPELVPEYAEKVTGQGAKEDIDRKELLTESLDIFCMQQECAHKNGLKTTIQMTYASLFNAGAIERAKADALRYGDEISLSLLGLPCTEFRNKYKTRDFCIWMFDYETKKEIVTDVFEKFYQSFGFYPTSTGSYYMDADLIAYIKERYPMVRCAVATCWEEGPKAYHTCNNSWYTFMDGGPWAPWIPSRQNTHAPAENAGQDCGLVAIPHLSRDLMACYDGNGSNFGTHPQNILRGMLYQPGEYAADGTYGGQQYPYLYNLIDQYRYQAKFNRGYAYNMMFVGPGWMNKSGRWEAPYELLRQSYEDACAYYGGLKKAGELVDMTMSEFADYYRRKKSYTEPECALWRDSIYGSDKQLFWYCDPYMRAGVNMDQGGALVDLRPYVSKLEWKVGIGTAHVQEAGYPFLIQEKYRAGYFTHYAGEGTVRSARLTWRDEQVDLCLCRTHARVERRERECVLTLDPVEIKFSGLTLRLQTALIFPEGTGVIQVERHVLDMSDERERVGIDEYMVACYGINEYPEDMTPITLSAEKDGRAQTLQYAYRCRECELPMADQVAAVIPPVHTRVTLKAAGENLVGYFKEGYAFSPMFTLGYTGTLRNKEVFTTWLSLEKEA